MAAVVAIPSEPGVVMMFVIAAIATALVILANTLYGGKNKEAPPAQFVQDFQTWRQEHEESEKKTQVFGGAIWLLIVAIYLLVSFLTRAWHLTWIIFLVGGALDALVKGIIVLVRSNKTNERF